MELILVLAIGLAAGTVGGTVGRVALGCWMQNPVAAKAASLLQSLFRGLHGLGVPQGADLARSLGVSEPTVRRLLDWMTGTFMVRQLQPLFENLGKRQVKSPKIYIRHSGLLHELLGIHDRADLIAHPKGGASWEGFALESTLRMSRPDEAYFWATHAGAELRPEPYASLRLRSHHHRTVK